MIDQSKWKHKDVWISSLQLDFRNPRIPITAVTQADLIADLIEHDGIYDLAKDISEQGYYQLKNILVVEEEGKYVVLEGNRRVTALKLLISYKLSPSVHKTKFKRLSDRTNLRQIKRIPAIVVPSREAAAPIILREHTISQIKSWSPVMQARFYYESLRDGVTIQDLAKEYSITPGDIKGFLQSYEMYRIACGLDLPLSVAAEVRDTRKFPLSTLDRIYSKPEVAALLGIEFDADKKLVGKVVLDEFKRAYARIVTDVAMDVVNSRALNNAKDFDKYVETLKKDAPDLSKKGSFTSSSILDSEGNKAASISKDPSVKPLRPARPLLPLIPRSYVVSSNDQRILAIILELQKVSARDYPNAVAALLRVLVDITVGLYCDSVGITKLILEKARAKENKPSDWYPTVRQLLNGLVNSHSNVNFHPLVLKAAQKLIIDNGTATIMTLDAFAHNRFVTPTESELRSIWVHIEEMIKVMAEPQPSVKNV